MHIYSRNILFLMTLFVMAAAGITIEGAEDKKLLREDYLIISQRNIFSKNRTKKTESYFAGTPVQAVISRNEESYLILRGITKLGNSFTAFIEDSRTMNVMQVKKGAAVAGGKVAEINLDFLTYEDEGKSITVKMGMTMEGAEAAGISGGASVTGFSQPQSNFTFSSTTVSNTDSTSAEDKKSILERLKERRKKELAE